MLCICMYVLDFEGNRAEMDDLLAVFISGVELHVLCTYRKPFKREKPQQIFSNRYIISQCFKVNRSRFPILIILIQEWFNREESPSFRVYGKFLPRQPYAIVRCYVLTSCLHFISVSLCLLLLLLLLLFIHLSLPKRSIWFRNSQQ